MIWLSLGAQWALAGELPETRRSPDPLTVRAAPSLEAALVGLIAANEAFVVRGYATGEGCDGPGWARVADEAFACLEHTEVTADVPVHLPRLLGLDGDDAVPAPYIYGKRWLGWHGRVWTSVASWAAGDMAVDQLDEEHTYEFVGTQATDRGLVFVRPNGSVVPASELYVYALSKFRGRDLVLSLLPEGSAAAWVVARGGARVRSSPTLTGAIGHTFPRYTAFVAQTVAVAGGEWWEVPDALGSGVSGYVRASLARRWISASRPAGVGPTEEWVDIDLEQQTLALLLGDTPVFVTLISSGVNGHETPKGVYRLYDKTTSTDMASLVDAEDVYHVDEVPWVMHFKPRYALHAAFWHDRFGRTASHGCVNLSPRDARTVFNWVHPVLPPGFKSVNATASDPGTVVRIRD